MGTREWESLPPELLHLISEQLPTLQDSIRFSYVCKSWRSVSDSAILHISSKKKNLPLLIVPYDKGDGHKKERKLGSTICDDTIGFISLFHHGYDHNQLKKVYKLYLPEIENRRICGCSEGWLVTFHENSEIQLLNPISRVLVHLPPVTTFSEIVGTVVSEENGLCYHVNNHPQVSKYFQKIVSHRFREFFLQKVVTNTDANSSIPTVVMAIYGGSQRLAFCRPSGSFGHGIFDRDHNDKQIKWISGFEKGLYDDITFYKGDFYAVKGCGSVAVVKGLDGISPYITIIIEDDMDFPDMNYLMESASSSSSGGGDHDLLMVTRRLTDEEEESTPCRTIEFKVWKLDFNGPSWVEVTNIGEDCALFVGYNRSFSFSASKFPGCKGNCIYFTDDNFEGFYEEPIGGHDMGVYNLEDCSFETLYETSSQLLLPPPIWYI